MTTARLLSLADPQASDPAIAGAKAATLARLAAAGLPVPPGAVVPVDVGGDSLPEVADSIAARFPGCTLAVRSSGVDEDTSHASFAGQYETVLDVPAEAAAILDALRRVRASAGAAHVGVYRPGHKQDMAVLVMPMLDPTAAGIAAQLAHAARTCGRRRKAT